MEHKNMNSLNTDQIADQVRGIVLRALNIQSADDYKDRDPALYFDAIEIKTSPHIHVCSIHGITIAPNMGIWIYTCADEPWQELKPTDEGYEEIIITLYQRVQYLFGHKKAA